MYDRSPSVVDHIVETLRTPVTDRTAASEVLTFQSPFTTCKSEKTRRVTQRRIHSSSHGHRPSYSSEGRPVSTRFKLSPPSDDSESEAESDEAVVPRQRLGVNLSDFMNATLERSNEEDVFDESINNVWQSSPLLRKLEEQLKRNRLQVEREFATVLGQTRKTFESEQEALPSGWKRLMENIEERNRQQAEDEKRQWSDIEKKISTLNEEKKQKQNEEQVGLLQGGTKNATLQSVQESPAPLHDTSQKVSTPKEDVKQNMTASGFETFAFPKEPSSLNKESASKLSDVPKQPDPSPVETASTQSTPWKEQIGTVGTRSIIASSSALLEASTYHQSLEELRKLSSNFVNDPSTASYRLHLKKRINLAANQIAASQKQILNKAYEIVDTLRKAGQSSKESQAYCFLCVVERLVEEGDKQVALHADSAFAIAAVIIAVTAEFSELKQLFMAQFHSACIFTIPAYAVRSKQDSVEKYWQSMGWKEGETFDRFLERMSGYLTLFAAVLQTEIPALANNVFGVASGWTWLARVVNMKPRRFTSFMLISFLDVAGYALYMHYGRQFEKILRLIEDHILPNLPSNAPPGPTARLQAYIQDFFKSKTIKEPQGRQLPTTDAENEDYARG